MKNIADSLEFIHRQVAAAESEFARAPGSVRLLAVSKTRPASEIQAAIQAGQFDFGENYLQEALDKMQHVADNRAVWHYIGPVQSNKTRQIAANFHWVHSIDRPRIARRLSTARADDMPPLNVCLQVNISGEKSKAGVPPSALHDLLEECLSLAGIRVRGLMAMPALDNDFMAQRETFRQVRELMDNLYAKGQQLDTLSLGTSQDYRAAIAEGSTLIRIGTGIFGPRD